MKKTFILLLALLLLISGCMEKTYNPPGFREFLSEARQEYPYLKSIKITNYRGSEIDCFVSLKKKMTYEEILPLAAAVINFLERHEVAEYFLNHRDVLTTGMFVKIENIVCYDRSPMTDDYEFVWREFIY